MKQTIYLVLTAVLTLAFANDSMAQRWKSYQSELYGGLGIANYAGDLGGGVADVGTSRPMGMIGYKYRFAEAFAVRGNFAFARVYGDDSRSEETGLANRNLNFRSNVMELSGQIEWYFLKENVGSSYRVDGTPNAPSAFSAYLFAGIGAFYYSPQGENGTDTDDWVNLSDLNTEGQGLPGAVEDYSNIAVCVPMGLGVKYSFSPEWSIGFEGSFRMTTTDYLDDVSGPSYYDNDAIRTNYGDMAADMADKRLTDNRFSGGTRGSAEYKDWYGFGMFTVSYRLRSGIKNRTRF